MLLDIGLGAILLASTFGAAANGLTRELLRIAALVVGLLVAMWGYGALAGHLTQWITNTRIASIAAFTLLFVACLLAGALLAKLLAGVWSVAGLGLLDRLLGATFGALRGLLLTATLLLVLIAFQPVVDMAELVSSSRVAPLVLNVARTAAVVAPDALRDAFRDGLGRIEEQLENDSSTTSCRRCKRPISAAQNPKPDQGPFRLGI